MASSTCISHASQYKKKKKTIWDSLATVINSNIYIFSNYYFLTNNAHTNTQSMDIRYIFFCGTFGTVFIFNVTGYMIWFIRWLRILAHFFRIIYQKLVFRKTNCFHFKFGIWMYYTYNSRHVWGNQIMCLVVCVICNLTKQWAGAILCNFSFIEWLQLTKW